MSDPRPGRPKLLYIQSATKSSVEGYLRKANRDPASGGGQRDVRIRRVAVFEPVLRRMFPIPGQEPVLMSGTVHWMDEQGSSHSTTVEIKRPTGSRSHEPRIATSYTIGSWYIDLDEWLASKQRGERWFYLLLLDSNDRVWARVLREDALPDEAPRVRQFIQRRIEATKGNSAVRGALDFETGKEYPE